MRWLRNNGVTASYEDYRALPVGLLEDCRLLMEADVKRAQWEASRGNRR